MIVSFFFVIVYLKHLFVYISLISFVCVCMKKTESYSKWNSKYFIGQLFCPYILDEFKSPIDFRGSFLVCPPFFNHSD